MGGSSNYSCFYNDTKKRADGISLLYPLHIAGPAIMPLIKRSERRSTNFFNLLFSFTRIPAMQLKSCRKTADTLS